MSVKKLITLAISVIALTGFITLGVVDAIKTKDNLEFQKLELKNKQTEIQKLNDKYNTLNKNLEDAEQEHSANQEQIKKLEQEKLEYEQQLKEKEAQLQAKAASNAKVAAAQTNAPSGNCVEWAKQAGITNAIAHELISRENTSCNPCIYNDGSPTGAVDCNYSGGRAYGIPQSLPGNKMASEGADWRTNPVTQLRWMQKYVYGRYGSWENAKEHHDRMGWY